MNGSDPVPNALRIVLDELLSDPRAASVIELAQNANELLAAFRGRQATVQPTEPAAQAQAPRPTPRQRLLFGERDVLTRDVVRKRRAALAALCHPDSGGNASVMAELNAAADELLAECATESR